MTTLLQKTFSAVSSVRWYITSISILDHKRRMLYLNTLNHFTILCVLIRVLAGILPQSLKDSCETRLPFNLVNQRFVAIHSVFILFYCPFFRGEYKVLAKSYPIQPVIRL